MSECKFAVEAFHAYIESIGLSRPAGTLGELKAFKAGAEWQRSLAQAELAELKAELALALKVQSIAAMHTWLDSECAKKNKQLGAELAALKVENAELVAALGRLSTPSGLTAYGEALANAIDVLAKHRGEK